MKKRGLTIAITMLALTTASAWADCRKKINLVPTGAGISKDISGTAEVRQQGTAQKFKVSMDAAVRNGAKLTVKWHAADALNNISKCEYSLDGGEWKVAAPVTKLSDGPELDYSVSVDAAAGEHTVAVRVEDEYGNQAVEKTVVR